MDILDNFLKGIAGSAGLLNRAIENGSFIECVCIYANQIDALLRIGVILDSQLKENNSTIVDNLLYQNESDKIIYERSIYKRALENNIISQNLFDNLSDLYDKRNRVVHRYIISGLTTKDILDIAVEYETVYKKIITVIANLETKQIKSNCGMTVLKRCESSKLNFQIINMINDKHGGINLT